MKMKNVGFYGGSLIIELGPIADMQAFFYAITIAALQLPTNEDSRLLTDRLYRRYLRVDELGPAIDLLNRIQKIMHEIPTNSVDWSDFKWEKPYSLLGKTKNTLGELLEKYLKSTQKIIKNAQSFQKKFNIYEPVITIITDTPRFYIESARPLAEYDALEGDPMWLR